MKNALFLIALFFAVLLSACSGSSSLSAAGLEGDWTLVALNGKAPVAGSKVTASFNNGEVGGNTGCNSYGGQYKVSGEKITFSAIFQTEMACMDPEGVMDQESAYTQALGQVASFTIADGKLQLQNAAGDVVLEYSQ